MKGAQIASDQLMAFISFQIVCHNRSWHALAAPCPAPCPFAYSHSDSDCESKLHKARSDESGETLVGQVGLLVGARSEGKSELRDYRLAE